MKSSVPEARVTLPSVKVKPNARSSALAQLESGSWLAQFEAQPVDGKANEELISLVARQFGCPKSAVLLERTFQRPLRALWPDARVEP